MSMTNFRAQDMPGNADYAPAADAIVGEAEVEEAPKAPAKKAPAKKPAAKKTPAKTAEVPATVEIESTDESSTETHGVGPSTVEGGNAPAEESEAEQKSDENKE